MRAMTEYENWVARARSIPIEREIERRGIELKHVGTEWIGPCPQCGGDDRFGVNPKKGVWHCRGCDKGGDVIELAMHLDGVDFVGACQQLAGEPPPKKRLNGRAAQASKKKVGSWEYQAADGSVAFAVDRYQFAKPDGSWVLKNDKPQKVFSQRRPDPDRPGGWVRNKEGVQALPYRLPEVTEAIATERPVLIVEGEAKAELLWSLNVAATCCAGGAKKWTEEHTGYLRDADVVLVPDNDNAGWEHINTVGKSLTGVAKHVRVLLLPHKNAKDDILDWAAAGGTRDQLDALLAGAQDWKPPAPEEQDKARAAAKRQEDDLIEGLLKLKPGIEFHRQRDEVAKELDVKPSAINDELKARREKAPLFGHWTVEPWPETTEGDSLLRDIIRRVQRHIVCSPEDALIIALWVMFSWVHDECAIFSPLLLITSAAPESGKTTTLSLISYLAPRAIASVDISKAALYRSIQLWSPSFIIDEFDDVLASKDEGKQELRSVINSGHVRGQGVIRCITDEHRPEMFSTFAAKALGMIGRKLPPATLTRCIIVELKRRTKEEKIERFAHKDDDELAALRRRLRRWAFDNADSLQADANMPPEFDNRRADNWRTLFAIADLCSNGIEEWGDKALAAARKVEEQSDTGSIGAELLADIRRLRREHGGTVMTSATMVDLLNKDPEAPWGHWSRSKGLTQNSLTTLLGGGGGRGRKHRGGFGIRTKVVTLPGGSQARGYEWSQFEDAWKRYLPPEDDDDNSNVSFSSVREGS